MRHVMKRALNTLRMSLPSKRQLYAAYLKVVVVEAAGVSNVVDQPSPPQKVAVTEEHDGRSGRS